MQEPQDVDPGQPDYVERLNQNVPWLAERAGMSLKRIAGVADISFTTLRNWLRGIGSPTLSKLSALGAAVGVDATDLLLPHDELVAKVSREGLRPFVLRPGASLSSSRSGLEPSGAAKRKARSRADKSGLSPLCQPMRAA